MLENTNLAEGREELKRRLTAGDFKSSVDVILESVGRWVQRLTGRKELPAPWVSALATALLLALVAYVSSRLTGGMSRDGYRTIALGATLLFSDLVIAKSAFDRAFATLRDKLLDGLESGQGLRGIGDWLAAAGDATKPAVIGAAIYAAYVAFLVPAPLESSAETVVVGGAGLLWTGFMIYYMFLFAVLAVRLSRCQFKLHAEDPVTTEVLADWSSMMSFEAYMFALMLAAGTLFNVTMETSRVEVLVFAIARWMPLIALFVVNQMAISQVITRSRRKTLNKVQAQMAALRPRKDPPDKETMDTLLGLWDYHDRIKGSRSLMLDIKGILNLVNTLLIPLLAFLISNREAIAGLLGWRR
jgi:hypothetical protein